VTSRRLLGVDFGDVRIGLAVSDLTGTLCSPLETLLATGGDTDIRRIVAIAEREGAAKIVVGLPINMDGTHGPAARRVQSFCGRLRRATRLEVVAWDERLSSFEAESRLRAGGTKPSRQRHKVDAAAAALILEAYLAATSRQEGTSE
jgi:putative holliday junction resolvase